MRWISRLLIAGSLAVATPALADLYTVEKDGEIFITSRPMKGARVIHHESARHAPAAAVSGGRSRRVKISGNEVRRAKQFEATVKSASKHYTLPEAIIWAVMKTESNFYPEVVSNKGAQGLMQLMPGTAKDMGVSDAFNPSQNIYGGTRFLRILANKFNGDMVLMISAYHAGGGAVNKAGGIPYSQTAEYVRRVLNKYYAYQKRLPTGEVPGQ
ncbi:MAG: soluble lytic murein transglycosylase-like protein [Bradymonadia bacterium]|jgi:soluble lytic murein transglycosylase-like protein